MTDVFISYKREERARCLSIHDALVELKLSVWFDAHIEPGTDFDREIEREVRAAKVVLVLWSALAADSDWIRAEARTGRQGERLVAARLDDCLPPLEFASVQAVDLFGPSDFRTSEEWRQIVQRIGRLVGRPGLGDYLSCEQKADARAWRGWIAAHPGDPLTDAAKRHLAALPDHDPKPRAVEEKAPASPEAGRMSASPFRWAVLAGVAGVLLLSAAWIYRGGSAAADGAAPPSAPTAIISPPPPAAMSDITEAFVPGDLGTAVCGTGPFPIDFDADLAGITPESTALLDMLGKVARDCGGRVEIAAPNDRMAAVVQNYLEGRGVPRSKMDRRSTGAAGGRVDITLH